MTLKTGLRVLLFDPDLSSPTLLDDLTSRVQGLRFAVSLFPKNNVPSGKVASQMFDFHIKLVQSDCVSPVRGTGGLYATSFTLTMMGLELTGQADHIQQTILLKKC